MNYSYMTKMYEKEIGIDSIVSTVMSLVKILTIPIFFSKYGK